MAKIILLAIILLACSKEKSNEDCWKIVLTFKPNTGNNYFFIVNKGYVWQKVNIDSMEFAHWNLGEAFCRGYNKSPDLSGCWQIERRLYDDGYYIKLKKGDLAGDYISTRAYVDYEAWLKYKIGDTYCR